MAHFSAEGRDCLASVSSVAPANIALVKYWGKHPNPALAAQNVPLAGSLSLTMNPDDMASRTVVRMYRKAGKNGLLEQSSDTISLNGEEPKAMDPQSRAGAVLAKCREHLRDVFKVYLKAGVDKRDHSGRSFVDPDSVAVEIVSTNDFPTAAGLASSASGFAALAIGLYALFDFRSIYTQLGVAEEDRLEVTTLARIGSGSACRSIFGGVVLWDNVRPALESAASSQVDTKIQDKTECTTKSILKKYCQDSAGQMRFEEDEHSFVSQLQPEGVGSLAREIEILVLVVNDKAKQVSSKGGMVSSAATSELLAHRAEKIVPRRLAHMASSVMEKGSEERAKMLRLAQYTQDKFGIAGSEASNTRKREYDPLIHQCDEGDEELFDSVSDVFEMTMRDSNQFHATCMDTFPPIVYMNSTSHLIVHIIHMFNSIMQESEAKASKRLYASYTFDAGPNAVVLVRKGVSSILLQEFIGSVFDVLDRREARQDAGSQDEQQIPAERLAETRKTLESEAVKLCSMHNGPRPSLRTVLQTRVGRGAHTVSDI